MEFNPLVSGTLQTYEPESKVACTLLQLTLATPERLSVEVPVTLSIGRVTVVPSVGEPMATDGAVLSIFIVMLVLAVFPMLSVAVPLIT